MVLLLSIVCIVLTIGVCVLLHAAAEAVQEAEAKATTTKDEADARVAFISRQRDDLQQQLDKTIRERMDARADADNLRRERAALNDTLRQKNARLDHFASIAAAVHDLAKIPLPTE